MKIQPVMTKILALSVQGITARMEHRETNDLIRAYGTYNLLCSSYDPYNFIPVASADEWMKCYLTRSMCEWYSSLDSRYIAEQVLYNHYCDTLPLLKYGERKELIPTDEHARLAECLNCFEW